MSHSHARSPSRSPSRFKSPEKHADGSKPNPLLRPSAHQPDTPRPANAAAVALTASRASSRGKSPQKDGPTDDGTWMRIQSSGEKAGRTMEIDGEGGVTEEEHDKDGRIRELEGELRRRTEEFEREVAIHATNEASTATYWQNKYSQVHSQFLRVDAELRVLKLEMQSMKMDCKDTEGKIGGLKKLVVKKETENHELRRQIVGLKEWVSLSTRSLGSAMADEVVAENWSRIGNELQNWVLVNYRKAKIDLTSTPSSTLSLLTHFVPSHSSLGRHYKVHLLTSISSQLLIARTFSRALFPGLTPEQNTSLHAAKELLQGLTDQPELINQWKVLTLTILSREQAMEKLAAETEKAVEETIREIREVLGHICGCAAMDPSTVPSGNATLRSIVQSVLTLQRQFASQKAIFTPLIPPMTTGDPTYFDATAMEDIGGEEEDDDGLGEAGREIWCVGFPGVEKRGDEVGENLGYRNVVVKAKVLCRPAE